MPDLMKLALALLLTLPPFLSPAEDQPVQIVPNPGSGHVHPSICRTPDGSLVVVYKGANVLMATRSHDNGLSWDEPSLIPASAKRPDSIREVKIFECYPGTADTLPDGRVLVTWNYIADDKKTDGYYERALLYTTSTDGGKTWSEQGLIGPVDGKHLGAVRHNVLVWPDGRWLLPLRGALPRLFDPVSKNTEVMPLAAPGGKAHAFQQIVRTAKDDLLAMGPEFLRSTDEGKTWHAVANFPAAPDGDSAEGRYLTVLGNGGVLVTWGVGTQNKGLRYDYSADGGQTWEPDKTVTLLPDLSVAARFYSARTIELDPGHVGTVFMNGAGVHFLRVSLARLAR